MGAPCHHVAAFVVTSLQLQDQPLVLLSELFCAHTYPGFIPISQFIPDM